MDLGAEGWRTFRFVTLPAISTALVAGALLAFGLSFDEIVVTNFTAGTKLTLPIWIYNHIRTPREQPAANAVALVLMLVSIVPVYLAQRLTEAGTESVAGSIAAGGATGR
jgi:putative spermidine/putrescine transport system permease protein